MAYKSEQMQECSLHGTCMEPSLPLGLSSRLERTAHGDAIQSQGHCNVGSSLGIQYKVRKPKQG